MRKKLITNFALIGFSRFATMLIQFATTIILARFLVPEDFGVVAMCSVFLNLSTLLVDSGLGGSLIYYQDSGKKDFDTVFWFNLAISFLLYISLFACSNLIADFYGHPIISSIIKVSGLALFLHSFCLIQNTLLMKELQFKTHTKLVIFATFSSSICVIILACNGFGVWAIACQTILMNFFQMLFYIALRNYKPGFSFSVVLLKKHLSMGSKLLVSSIIKIIYDNMYVQLIGKIMSISQAGFYNQAKRWNDVPINIVQTPLDRVIFPTLAKEKEKNKKIIEISKYFSIIAIPIFLCGSMVACDFIELALGKKWSASGPMLSLMLIGSIGACLENLDRNFIKSTGEVGILLKTDVVKRICNLMILILLLPLGIRGILYAFIINGFLGWFFNVFALKKITSIKVFSLINPVVFSFIHSAVIYVCVKQLLKMKSLSCMENIFASTFLFVLFFVLSSFIFYRSLVLNLFSKLKNLKR
jgi:O-antigen/teichoic acid export membrane protein